MSLISVLPYLGGRTHSTPHVLERFLPSIPEGIGTAFLERHAISHGAWILDPFGASPELTIELARGGYRVLVAVNNPVTRFLLELAAQPPDPSDLQAALAELASARKGGERLESHLQSLYLTECIKCRRSIPAEAFIWERGGTSPVGRIYHCPCGEGGEQNATEADKARSDEMKSAAALHRARALERVAAIEDPERENVEEALECYLPRPVYALITIANKLEGLPLPSEKLNLLRALLLFACDEANTLWPYPAERPRPRQLTIPPRFLEKNVWMALERGVGTCLGSGVPVPLEVWPTLPPENGGICLYEGPIRNLVPHLQEISTLALVAVIPRPNQAFWTLSALWAGWLWGRTAVTPFRSVLHRRRYDWDWHAAALHAALKNLAVQLPLQNPFFGILTEPEPSFLTAILLAASAAGFDLGGLALRTRHDPLQVIWNRRAMSLPIKGEIDAADVREAMQEFLRIRGEPATYLHLHAAGLSAMAEGHALGWQKGVLSSLNAPIQEALSPPGFVHYSSGDSVESGLWGLVAGNENSASLSDQVELLLVPFLQSNPGKSFSEIEEVVNMELRGLFTPSIGMVREVLVSYGVETSGSWSLREEDLPSCRRVDLETAASQLTRIGDLFGYRVVRHDKDGRALIWDDRGKTVLAYYLLSSAISSEIIRKNTFPPERSLLVLPGGRSGLLSAKLRRDKSLELLWNAGWRVLKFRQLRKLSESKQLERLQWEQDLAEDPLEPPEQLRLF